MENDLESFFRIKSVSKYKWVKGNALTENGVPTYCANHQILLTWDANIINGKRRIFCPRGDTEYKENIN